MKPKIRVETSPDGKSTYEVHELPNELKEKVGPGVGFSQAAISRAEQAVAGIAETFGRDLQRELETLREAVIGLSDRTGAPEVERIFNQVHEIRGLAGSFGFPLVSRIGSSLCRLIESGRSFDKPGRILVQTHVNAMLAVLRQQAKGEDHEVGRELAQELEAQVRQLCGGKPPSTKDL